MPDVLFFNGRFTTTDEPVLKVEDRGFLFGDGVYEVFKFLRRQPIFLEDHWRRLQRGLQEIEIVNPWDEASFATMVRDLLDRTEFEEGIVYIEVSRGEGERAHVFPDNMIPTAIAFSRRHKFPDAAKKEQGIRLISTPDIRWKHCDVKSVNLLGNALAKKKAARAGGDEALFIDEGVVTECASSSFFIVKDGRIVTHPLDEHILPGVTRDRTMGLAREDGVAVEERRIAVAELDAADEVFVTSTSLAVMPVQRIDDRIVGGGVRGAVTTRLQRLLDEAELRESERAGSAALR